MCSARNSQDDVEDDFWFETETLPLKGNKDYANLLRTLCLLEGQRTQALKDIDKLLEIQDEAMEDPVAFASKLFNNEDLGIPSPQIVPDLPEIDWSKYKVALPPEAFRPQTRNAGQRTQPENNEKPNVIKVRGRVYDNSKPITFNQLWTVEEQLRLEELLVKFPPEENETKRYMKIAEALGNRTVTQVSSRCQKYFLKLQKAGLPVPGRTPKIKSDYYKAPKYTSHQHSRNNAFLYPRSTFFPQLMPPVSMHEGEDLPGTVICQPGKSNADCEEESVEDENFSEEVKNTDDFRKFMLLKRVKKDKEKPGDSSKTVHIGFRCNSCNEGPITGTRWHCTDCNDQDSIDFCSECIISQLESNKPHPLEHKIVPIRHQEYPAWDKDYSYQSYMGNSSNYNYLDPTFMPQ